MGETKILRVLDHPFLNALSTHSVMKIRIDLGTDEESAGWWMLRQIFSSPDIMPIPIFDTRVNESIMPHQEQSEAVASYNMEDINDLHFEEKKDLLHSEWSVLQKKTDLQMNVPNDLIIPITEKEKDNQKIVGCKTEFS